MADKPEEVKNEKDSKNKEPKKGKTSMSEFKGEFRQIKWPTKKELRKQVITTIITCLIVVCLIFVMDYVVSFSLQGAGQLLGVEEFDFFGQIDWGDFDFDFMEDDVLFEDLDFEDFEAEPDFEAEIEDFESEIDGEESE